MCGVADKVRKQEESMNVSHAKTFDTFSTSSGDGDDVNIIAIEL